MLVRATILVQGRAVQIPLNAQDMDDLARIFELGVNVGPDTPQTIRVVITTPGYEEGETHGEDPDQEPTRG